MSKDRPSRICRASLVKNKSSSRLKSFSSIVSRFVLTVEVEYCPTVTFHWGVIWGNESFYTICTHTQLLFIETSSKITRKIQTVRVKDSRSRSQAVYGFCSELVSCGDECSGKVIGFAAGGGERCGVQIVGGNENLSWWFFPSKFVDLYLGPRIKELFEVPTSIEFVRDYVGRNIPVIVRGVNLKWPAVSKWNSHFFRWVQEILMWVYLTR